MGGAKGFGLLHVGTGPGHLLKLKDRPARKTPLIIALRALTEGEHFWNRACLICPLSQPLVASSLCPTKAPCRKGWGQGLFFSPPVLGTREGPAGSRLPAGTGWHPAHSTPPLPCHPPVTKGPSPRRCGGPGAGDALGSWHVSQGHAASLLQGSSALPAALDSELLPPVISSSRWRCPGLLLPAEPSHTIFTGSDE